MFLDKLNKRERYLTLVTVAIVSLFVLYAFIIDPISSKWRSLNNQIRSKAGILSKDSKILVSEQALEAEYALISKHAQTAGNEDQQAAATLDYIEKISKNDSCVIINIKPIDIRTTESYKEILIDVDAEGSMQNLSKFLYDMENPRDNLINIKRFTITGKSSQSDLLKGSFIISKISLD